MPRNLGHDLYSSLPVADTHFSCVGVAAAKSVCGSKGLVRISSRATCMSAVILLRLDFELRVLDRAVVHDVVGICECFTLLVGPAFRALLLCTGLFLLVHFQFGLK